MADSPNSIPARNPANPRTARPQPVPYTARLAQLATLSHGGIITLLCWHRFAGLLTVARLVPEHAFEMFDDLGSEELIEKGWTANSETTWYDMVRFTISGCGLPFTAHRLPLGASADASQTIGAAA